MTDSFVDLVDLACERFGGSVVASNDEFFGAKENLIKRDPPIWIEGKYTERGKWMDGWETRRRRGVTDESHDWCILRLGAAGHVSGVNVDTTNFKGNYPAACAIDVTDLGGVPSVYRYNEYVSETTLYDVVKNDVVWTGTIKTTEPENVRTAIKSYVEAVMKVPDEKNLIRKRQ